jgi:hypothetical protein
MVGQRISGRYEVEELAGKGGMSSVFRARDTVLERPVALKILHEHYTQDAEYVERFRREARAIAQLSHPNIVTVIDRGEYEGRQYIVFELVPGENLKEVVEREGALPVERALALTHQIARGLAFAHEHGIVHRDVKPQNVLLDEEGAVKVTDFGTARSLDPGRGITQTGTLLGTSDYIAPEQASGAPVDERSDQYSLGVLLYELLTGEVPFTGPSFMAVAMRHVQDPVPSVRERRGDVPSSVEAVVRRALAKRPEDRFPSTEAMAAALETCLADVSTEGGTRPLGLPVASPTRSPSRPRRRGSRAWSPLVLGLGVLAAGAAALAFFVGGIGEDGGDGLGAGAQRVPLTALSDYDPDGDEREHPEDVPLATDGDTATYWTTETYRSFLKDGVGLVLDAGRPVELTEIVLITDQPGFQARIQASSRPNANFQHVTDTYDVTRRTIFKLDDPGEQRYYLVWITDPNGRAHVNEVRGRA